MSTFYIDTTSFTTASSIWTDANLISKAPNGFYQKNGVYRRMANGELLPAEICPSCETNPLPAFTASSVQATSSIACSQLKNSQYYFDDINSSGGTAPNVGDGVYLDQFGVNKLPAGFYSLPSGQYIEVDSIGLVISSGSCALSQFTIYWNTATSPNQYGWDSSSLACAGTGAPFTVHINGTASSLFDAVVTQGKSLYRDSAKTILFNGNNTWFKTTNGANQGGVFQIGVSGDVFNWNNSCI